MQQKAKQYKTINMLTGKVVHCKREPFDVYIGRDSNSVRGKFGNTFSHKKGTKAEVYVDTIEQAMSYFKRLLLEGAPFLNEIGIESDSELFKILMEKRDIILKSLPELKGKVLGCWCKIKGHEPCHGDIYVELTEKL